MGEARRRGGGVSILTATENLEPAGTFAEVLTAERATAKAPTEPAARLALLEQYRRLGLDRAATAEVVRLLAQFPEDPTVVAAMLDILSDRRAMSALGNLLDRAERLGSAPPPALRLAIARAATVLGRLPQAAAQFAALAVGRCRRVDLWRRIAEFVRGYPATEPLPAALKKLSRSGAADDLPPVAHYAILRALLERDRIGAVAALDRIDLAEIADPATVVDLAVGCLRLGRWDMAVAASRQAVACCSDPVSPARALISGHAFAGRFTAAAAARRLLSDPAPAVALTVGQLTAVGRFVRTAVRVLPVWGVLCPRGGQDHWQIRRHTLDGIPTGAAESAPPHLGGASAMVVSIPGPPPHPGGPVDLLEDLDWGTPHLLVQRDDDDRCRLHAFVPINATDAWAWEEVPITADPAAAAAEGFAFLPAEDDGSTGDGNDGCALWRRIERELHTAAAREKKEDA